MQRKYPIGAEIIDGAGVHFRVWAPDHREVELALEIADRTPLFYPMEPEPNGYFSLLCTDACEGSLYQFRLSRSKQLYCDPASRYQPHGPSGPSCVVNPTYSWTDEKWGGLGLHGHVAYEMHIGTFTQAGTFEAAARELKELAELGISFIELLPINDFPGDFGWGYDGVNLFAPTHLYGTPQDLKRFIDSAHQLDMGVVLDVVYNHLGPEDNQMINFSQEYLSDQFGTDWGKAINFDSPESRNFFLTNARYWIEEYHFDGLRLDATPWLFSSTHPHILEDLSRTIKAAGGKRKVLVIGENEQQDTKLLRPYDKGGYGFDMLWNDDFHHSAHVRLTGKREAYYTDYLGSPQEFISSLKYGFLYQGQYYDWQKKERGTPDLNLPPHSMIIYLENHDQIANSAYGLRLHKESDMGNYKALVTLLLLSPNTPLIFQGQEFSSKQPFYYFAHHSPALSPLVRSGRRENLAQFPRLATTEIRQILPDPGNPMTFVACKLEFRDRETNAKTYQLYRDLIKLRRTDPVFKKMQACQLDGAVLTEDAFLIRYFGGEDGDRILIVNFGPDHYFNPAPEPLIVAGPNLKFEILWSSESWNYGGEGTPPINVPYWKMLGHSAIVLKTTSIDDKQTT